MAQDELEMERDDSRVAEIIVAWSGDGAANVLRTFHLAGGEGVRVGEAADCDLQVAEDLLGSADVEVVTFDGGEATVRRPPRGRLRVDGILRDEVAVVVREGQVAEMLLGDPGALTLRVAITKAGRRVAPSLGQAFRQSGLGGVGLSAFVHGALLAAVGLFVPALTEGDAEAMERDQILLMQKYLNASAEAEQERKVQEALEEGAADAPAPDPGGGARAKGPEGRMGKENPTGPTGHWTAAGNAKPADVTLSHEAVVREAQTFGMLGILATAATGDPNAPTVPWESVLNGSERESHYGNFWDDAVGDSLGHGLGMSGTGESGGGRSEGIGLNDFGGLSRSLGNRMGPGGGFRDGIGGCKGGPCGPGLGGTHRNLFVMRMPEKVETNGRIPPEVIQRIVRQNQGRFRSCYEAALSRNPNLEGRVAVRFVIDREGSVSVAGEGDSGLPDEGVRKCVVRSFYALSFPAPQGGTVTVTYPIYFSPSG